MSNRLCQFVQMEHVKQLTKPIFLLGLDSWCYEVRSVDISSATTKTTTKAIECLQTKWITPEGMTGEEIEDSVEAAALPAPSPLTHVHRSEEMGILGRDVQEFCPRGKGGFILIELAAEDPPLRSGAPAKRNGEQDSKLYMSPPYGRSYAGMRPT